MVPVRCSREIPAPHTDAFCLLPWTMSIHLHSFFFDATFFHPNSPQKAWLPGCGLVPAFWIHRRAKLDIFRPWYAVIQWVNLSWVSRLAFSLSHPGEVCVMWPRASSRHWQVEVKLRRWWWCSHGGSNDIKGRLQLRSQQGCKKRNRVTSLYPDTAPFVSSKTIWADDLFLHLPDLPSCLFSRSSFPCLCFVGTLLFNPEVESSSSLQYQDWTIYRRWQMPHLDPYNSPDLRALHLPACPVAVWSVTFDLFHILDSTGALPNQNLCSH